MGHGNSTVGPFPTSPQILISMEAHGRRKLLRSSRDDAEKHRKEIIDASARLFRERGVDSVSVPALMEAVGMTHGGFYKHFASKDQLVPLAYEKAFDQIVETLADASGGASEGAAAWDTMVDNYLSPRHRDNIGAGCPAAAFASDAARLATDSPARAAYDDGIERMLKTIGSLGPGSSREQSLVALSTLLGALLLSRATGGELSDAVLSAARAHLQHSGLTKA
jgi:TetR/AcrR family transcriptional regulator, transcriptional repressor for nem operon